MTSPHGRGLSSGSRAQDALGQVAGTSAASTTWVPNSEHQANVLRCVEANGLVLAIGGYGSGKSECAALLLLKWALRNPRRADGNPTEGFIVGPEFALIRKVQFRKVLSHAKRFGALGYGDIVRRVVKGMEPRIELRDGQVLHGMSGDNPDRLEGNEVEYVWIDEGHRQKEDLFGLAFARLRSSDAVRMVISANPEDPPDWMWRMINGEDEEYNKLRASLIATGSGMRVFRWGSRENTANRAEVLDVVSAALNASTRGGARAKMTGLFRGTKELPHGTAMGHRGRAFVEMLELGAPQAFALGVDIGEIHDFTWLTAMSKVGVQLEMERFNAGSPEWNRATFLVDAEDQIIAVAIRLGVQVVVIDTAKHGKHMAQSIERKIAERSLKFRVLLYDTSGRRKKANAIASYFAACSKGDVKIPLKWRSGGITKSVEHVAQLAKEFEEIVVRDEGAGLLSFDHPPGAHDDGIVSGALAWHGVTTKVGGTQATGLGAWKGVDLRGARGH